MTDTEWAPIPGFKNYEVNKDGEVRTIDDKKVRGFGKTCYLYSNPNHPFKMAMLKAMAEIGR